jgi:hypothetical protein
VACRLLEVIGIEGWNIVKFSIIAESGEAWEFLKQQAEIDGTLDEPWPTLEKLLLIAKASLFPRDELSDSHFDKRRNV